MSLAFARINGIYRSFSRQALSHTLFEVEMLCTVNPLCEKEGFLVSGLLAKRSRQVWRVAHDGRSPGRVYYSRLLQRGESAEV